MPNFKDLTGKTFGRWTVLYRAKDYISPKGVKKIRYHCRCDCGNEGDVQANALSMGKSKSCGCLQLEWAYEIGNQKKHGLRRTRLYRIWANMYDRCKNEYNRRFSSYGGRGIEICSEWQGENGFMTFYNWAMSNGYDEKLSIDRIDNNGNYCADNCRWVDNKTQSNNRSSNRRVTVDGIDKTIAEWSEYLNVSRNILYKASDDAVIEKIKALLAKESKN